MEKKKDKKKFFKSNFVKRTFLYSLVIIVGTWGIRWGRAEGSILIQVMTVLFSLGLFYILDFVLGD